MLTTNTSNSEFDLAAFLSHDGPGRRIVEFKEKETSSPKGPRQTPSFIFSTDG